ncbi:MAG: serine/threonine-protein kinase HipA [Paracoccaceae bacterium]
MLHRQHRHGALEYSPTKDPRATKSNSRDIDALVPLAGVVLSDENSLSTSFDVEEGSENMKDFLKVGYSDWILKFDGMKDNKNKEATAPKVVD